METVVLIRKFSGDDGTFGVVLFGDHSVFSGELPWRDNRPSVSCIPAGKYTCRWIYSPAFKRRMYGVDGVLGRSGIRIHSANYMGDRSLGLRSHLLGCIALGEKLGVLGGQKALLRSAPAVRRLEQYMEHKTFTLEIRYA